MIHNKSSNPIPMSAQKWVVRADKSKDLTTKMWNNEQSPFVQKALEPENEKQAAAAVV
jgi:hypothetical protein